MQKRRLGNTDIEITAGALGTWALGGWLWGGTDRNEPEVAVRTAIDAGINCIDTAPVYGFGLSEELVGDAIQGRRDEVIVATKCGLVWDGREGGTHYFDTVDAAGRELAVFRCLRKSSIMGECEDSLRRLKVDVIDLYQCHWPDPGTPIDETMDALLTLRQQGKIRAFGVSNFSVDQLTACLETTDLASNQPHYSLLSRDIEADVLPFCREQGISVLAYSPMEMGLLTGKISMAHEFPESDVRSKKPWFQPEKRRAVLAALDQIRHIAEAHEATLAQLAVAWITSQPGVTTALVGARSGSQARDNAAAGALALTGAECSTIRSVFSALTV